MDIFQTTTLDILDIQPSSSFRHVVEKRANIFELTQAAEASVLRPETCGAYSHPLRAALAARVARINNEASLAERYLMNAGNFASLADPLNDGSAHQLNTVIRFVDKVAADTKAVQAEDILILQAEGIDDADIVRLAELNSFLAYQIRVVAGLRLLEVESK